jgi:hypothetical protein
LAEPNLDAEDKGLFQNPERTVSEILGRVEKNGKGHQGHQRIFSTHNRLLLINIYINIDANKFKHQNSNGFLQDICFNKDLSGQSQIKFGMFVHFLLLEPTIC